MGHDKCDNRSLTGPVASNVKKVMGAGFQAFAAPAHLSTKSVLSCASNVIGTNVHETCDMRDQKRCSFRQGSGFLATCPALNELGNLPSHRSLSDMLSLTTSSWDICVCSSFAKCPTGTIRTSCQLHHSRTFRTSLRSCLRILWVLVRMIDQG